MTAVERRVDSSWRIIHGSPLRATPASGCGAGRRRSRTGASCRTRRRSEQVPRHRPGPLVMPNGEFGPPTRSSTSGVTTSSSRSSNSIRTFVRAKGSDRSTVSGPSEYRPRRWGVSVYETCWSPRARIPAIIRRAERPKRRRGAVLQQQERGGDGGLVLDLQIDGDALPGRTRASESRRRTRSRSRPHRANSAAAEREDHEAHRHHVDRRRAGDARDRPTGRGRRRTRGRRGRRACQALPATGTGTSGEEFLEHHPRVLPPMMASAVTVARCEGTSSMSPSRRQG